MTQAVGKLAQEDLSDVGILQLAGVLSPVVLFAADPDLIRHDVAARDWGARRALLGKIGPAEAVRSSTTTVELSGRSMLATARLARDHPLATGALAAAAGIYASRNRSRLPQARATLSRLGVEALKAWSEPFDRHERHIRTWTGAERGTERAALT